MAQHLNVGDNVRWHRPAESGRRYPAFLVDGSVGVVTETDPDVHHQGPAFVMVKFELHGETVIWRYDLTPYCPVNLSRPEEVEAWLAQ